MLVVAMSRFAFGQTSADVTVLSPDEAFAHGGTTSFFVAGVSSANRISDAPDLSSRPEKDAVVVDPAPNVLSDVFSPEQLTPSLRTVLLVGLLSLAPAALVMSTCFARFAIVLGLLKQGIGAQQWLPNQIVLALSLFLTIFVMAPVWKESYEVGVRPYVDGQYESPVDQRRALEVAVKQVVGPVRHFMSSQIAATGNEAAIDMLASYREEYERESAVPQYYEDVPLSVLLPAYLLSELKTAFVIGIQIVLPFLVIDLVVASILPGMGLMMLPPVLVSLPFKLLLFVLIDGWTLTVELLLRSVPMV